MLHLGRMPTTHPRYTVTDTGELRGMLDAAQRRWPEITDRRQLLLKLVTVGTQQVAEDVDRDAAEAHRQRQLEAWRESLEYVDRDVLMSREAWQ